MLQSVLLALAIMAGLLCYEDNVAMLSPAPAVVSATFATITPPGSAPTKTKTNTSTPSVSGEVSPKKTPTPPPAPVPSQKKPAPACDIKCKKKALVSAGITSALADSIISQCKASARDPVHCIKYSASVSVAESSGGKNCHKNGCFGIKSGRISYDSLDAGVADWVRRYNKYWYKATSVSNFYPARGAVSRFRYCTSEHSSNSSVGCPNGLAAAAKTFTSLSQSF